MRRNRSTYGVALRGITYNLPKERPSADETEKKKPQKASGESTAPPRTSSTGQVPTHSGNRNPSTPNKSGAPKSKPDPGAQEQQTQQRKLQARELEERKRRLYEERERLVITISKMEERNKDKKMELESLQEVDETEKWEDDLFKMRQEELRNARTVIETHSKTSNSDVWYYIRDLNDQIIRVASHTANQLVKKEPQASPEEITKILGNGFLGLFPKLKAERPMEKLLVQAILQIFLTRSCTLLLSSWNLEISRSGQLINSMYDCIRGTEEQMVAGKWRQITFAEIPHGTKTELLQEFAASKSRGVVEILSCAGWAGDTEKISRRVSHLMRKTEYLRMDIRAAVIYADFQPQIAVFDGEYDDSTMIVDKSNFGGEEIRDAKGRHILGSTGLGWKVGENVKQRTRVLLIESFGDRFRPSTK